MQHVIIFDGPDGCGKTNMAFELSKRLNIPYFKNQREKKFFEKDPGYFVRAMKYGDPFFCSYLKQTGASVILDRSYPSEWVYSQALQRPTEMDMVKMVDGLFSGLGAKVIIPYRTDYSVVDDEFEVLDELMLRKIDELYHKFAVWTSCDAKLLQVDDENLDSEMHDIMSFIFGVGGYCHECRRPT